MASILPILMAGVVCWVAGEYVGESLGPAQSQTHCEFLAPHCGAGVDISLVGVNFRVGWGWPRGAWEADHGDTLDRGAGARAAIGHECLGFLLGLRRAEYNGTPSVIVYWCLLGIPWWFVAALAAAPKLERRARRRLAAAIRHKRTTTLCPICGYDLRATPNRCPECGTVPEKAKIAH